MKGAIELKVAKKKIELSERLRQRQILTRGGGTGRTVLVKKEELP